MDYLLYVDFLGTGYNLTYKDSSKSRTFIGAILSFVLIVMFFVAFYIFGKEIFLREEPIVRSNQIFSRDNKLSLSDVPIMFTVVSNSAVTFTAEKMLKSLKIGATLTTLGYDSNNNFGMSLFNIAVEPCSTSNISPEFLDLLSKNNDPKFFLCLNKSKVTNNEGNLVDSEALIRNPFGYVDSSYITVGLSKCDEKENPGCSSWLEENQQFYVTRYYFTHYFDFTNYSKPTSRYDKNFTNRIDKNLTTKNYTRFTINELITDSGAIFKDESADLFFTVEKEYQFLSLSTETTTELVTFYHEVSFIKNNFYRRYITMQEVLANVGGFLKALMICASIFVKFYSQFVFFVSFREELILKRENLKVNNEVSVIKNVDSSSYQIKAKTRKELKISFWKYLVATVSKRKSFEYSINTKEIMKFLDLSYLTEKILSFEHQLKENKNSDVSVFNKIN